MTWSVKQGPEVPRGAIIQHFQISKLRECFAATVRGIDSAFFLKKENDTKDIWRDDIFIALVRRRACD